MIDRRVIHHWPQAEAVEIVEFVKMLIVSVVAVAGIYFCRMVKCRWSSVAMKRCVVVSRYDRGFKATVLKFSCDHFVIWLYYLVNCRMRLIQEMLQQASTRLPRKHVNVHRLGITACSQAAESDVIACIVVVAAAAAAVAVVTSISVSAVCLSSIHSLVGPL